jgi:hypothetical protein
VPQSRSGISRPNGIRSPDRPVRSESSYRLSHRVGQKDDCEHLTGKCWSWKGTFVEADFRGEGLRRIPFIFSEVEMQMKAVIIYIGIRTTSSGVSMSLYIFILASGPLPLVSVCPCIQHPLHQGVTLPCHGYHFSRFASEIRAETEETIEHGEFCWYL